MASVTGPMSVFLNARRVLGPQVAVAVAATLINVLLSLLLATSIGAAGPIWASIAVQGLVMWPVSLVLIRRSITSAQEGAH